VLQKSVGARTSLPHDITARREHGLLYLRRGQQDDRISPRKLTVGSPLEVPEAGCRICSRFLEGKEAGDIDRAAVEDPEQAFLSARKLTLPLTVRGRQSGDTFYPLGTPGHGKLKDFLIDRKIPCHRRDALPLVTTAEDRIAWVAGVEIAHPFRLRGG
jgi:tRNA(Ile)-lysidine synthase